MKNEHSSCSWDTLKIKSRLCIKVLRFSTNNDSSNKVEQLTVSNQTQVILRLLVGLTYEAWIKLVNDRFLKRSNITVEPTEKGKVAVSELQQHLSRSSLLGNIRNSFAFHYPDDEYMNKAFNLASQDQSLMEEWNWYLSTARTNRCYFVS